MKIFSVIIPVYNAEKTVKEALTSVERQTKAELVKEIIVIDDGSTDCSLMQIQSFEKECTIPMFVISQENAGPSSARNAGIRAASGDYIAFLDADDVWMPDKLERQWAVLKRYPQIDLLSGGLTEKPLRILLRSHKELYHATLKDYCWKSFIYTSTVVLRRERVAQAGFFDERMRYAEDMNYYQRFFRWNNVYYLPRKMTDYGKSREYYGQNGLSGQLRKMHEGRRHNFDVLRQGRQISHLFYWGMIILGDIKYLRRKFLVWRQMRCRKEFVEKNL